MNHLEKYLDRIIEQKAVRVPQKEPDLVSSQTNQVMPPVDVKPIVTESTEAENLEKAPDILGAIKRRWYVVLLVWILFTPLAVYGVWTFIQPGYIVSGRIKVAPAVLNIMTGNEEREATGNYREFVQSEAERITNSSVLQLVIDDIILEQKKQLKFFQEESSGVARKVGEILGREIQERTPLEVLKGAVHSGAINAVHKVNTHFIDVTMKSMYPDEAQIVIDSIIKQYYSLYTENSGMEGNDTLTKLSNERNVVYNRIQNAKTEIRSLAQDKGVTDISSGQEIQAERINTLLAKTIELESKRIALETELTILNQQQSDSNDIVAHDQIGDRETYINSDQHIEELSRQIVLMEQDLMIARQELAPLNPKIREKENLLAVFKSQLKSKIKERGDEFDAIVLQQQQKLKKEQMRALNTELMQVREEESQYKILLQQEELKSVEQNNAFMAIKDKQFTIDLDMEIYDTLSRRIKQLEMEQNGNPRISIEEYAQRLRYEDKRIPYSAGMAMGLFGLGCLLAIVIDKADKRLKEPEDAAEQMNLPLIGTVANAKTVKASMFAEQIASDYQTIRTNLSLLGAQGIPRLMSVTSPGPREGKSSFTVNLATSLAKSGERVLLVDGDLRKPDTLHKMNFAHMAEQVSHVPIEGGFEYSVWNVESSGLDILVPSAKNKDDVYELISSPLIAQKILQLSQKYDHVIIDTPPVMAFPDALIWAKITGSVILIGFANKTTIDDLIETKERLSQTNATLLGTVLNNVKVSHGYQRYHYGYYYQKRGRKDTRMNKKLLMAANEDKKKKKAKVH